MNSDWISIGNESRYYINAPKRGLKEVITKTAYKVVPGGRLYRETAATEDGGISVSITYAQDPT